MKRDQPGSRYDTALWGKFLQDAQDARNKPYVTTLPGSELKPACASTTALSTLTGTECGLGGPSVRAGAWSIGSGPPGYGSSLGPNSTATSAPTAWSASSLGQSGKTAFSHDSSKGGSQYSYTCGDTARSFGGGTSLGGASMVSAF